MPLPLSDTLEQAYVFARQSDYEADHAQHVMVLARLLFDKLRTIHGLDSHARELLSFGALLHDIGWVIGQAKHHKQSMQMILDDRVMDLNKQDRRMIALIARYHRKALPKPKHRVYGDLTQTQQKQIQLLGGLLRIADGLDRTHESLVKDVFVRVTDRVIEFDCRAISQADSEIAAARKKSDLFEMTTGYTCQFSSRIIE